jgi:hypothetical protein
MFGISEEEFIKTYTARKYVKNLRIHHPRFWFETWFDLHLVTITGRDTNCVPGAPNDKYQIIKNKMHQEMLVSWQAWQDIAHLHPSLPKIHLGPPPIILQRIHPSIISHS